MTVSIYIPSTPSADACQGLAASPGRTLVEK